MNIDVNQLQNLYFTEVYYCEIFIIHYILFFRKSFIINMDLVQSHWTKAENDARRIWIDEDNLKVST